MDDIIVLGLIPGTHIQITFVAWLLVASTLSVALLLRAGTRAKLFQAWIIATSIMVETQRRDQLEA
ncbi:MAG: hypothetical protein ACQR33_05625 [Candidatus Saccharibacteria bacterium]